jgi:hypothetical protein
MSWVSVGTYLHVTNIWAYKIQKNFKNKILLNKLLSKILLEQGLLSHYSV